MNINEVSGHMMRKTKKSRLRCYYNRCWRCRSARVALYARIGSKSAFDHMKLEVVLAELGIGTVIQEPGFDSESWTYVFFFERIDG